jgi:hypothetical protein
VPKANNKREWFNANKDRYTADVLQFDVKLAASAQERYQPATIGAIEAWHNIGDRIVRAGRPHTSKVSHGRLDRGGAAGVR